MNTDTVLDLTRQALLTAAKVSLPLLLGILAVGLLVGLLQSITQLQENTLSFVPKLLVVAAIVILAGNWMLNELITFTHTVISNAPNLVR